MILQIISIVVAVLIELVVLEILSAGPSDRLWSLSNFSVSGATGAKFGPSLSSVVKVPIDEGLSLTFRFTSYLDDVL